MGPLWELAERVFKALAASDKIIPDFSFLHNDHFRIEITDQESEEYSTLSSMRV